MPALVNNSQSGNILIIILIAIALLASLTALLTRSGSSTNETGDYESRVILATEILRYAKGAEIAVQSLLSRGCSENQISFWHDSDGNGTEDVSDAYFNSNAPANKSCHVFDVAGGGLDYKLIPERALNDDQMATLGGTFQAGHYAFAPVCAQFIGTHPSSDACTAAFPDNAQAHADLSIQAMAIEPSVCATINKLIHDDSTVPQDANNHANARFRGTFRVTAPEINPPTPYRNRKSGCFYSDFGIDRYSFFHILIAR